LPPELTASEAPLGPGSGLYLFVGIEFALKQELAGDPDALRGID